MKSPAAGDVWVAGSTYRIVWQGYNTSQVKLTLTLYTPGGFLLDHTVATYTNTTEVFNVTVPNNQVAKSVSFYDWPIPTDLNSYAVRTDYSMYIIGVNGPSLGAFSANFTINRSAFGDSC